MPWSGPIGAYPYLGEIRDTCEDALARFAEMEAAATRWLTLNDRAETSGWSDTDALQPMPLEHANVHRSLEAFLAAFARVSLLLYPKPRTKDPTTRAFAEARGECMRYLLDCQPDDPILDVELRNAWMHFDERMDGAGVGASTVNRQSWGHSRDTTLALRANALRHTELDTLRVFYRDQHNAPRVAELRPLCESIDRLYQQLRGSGWSQLRARMRATAGNPCL